MTQAAMDSTMVEVTLAQQIAEVQNPRLFSASIDLAHRAASPYTIEVARAKAVSDAKLLLCDLSDIGMKVVPVDDAHQSGRTGAGERETVARVIHQCLRPVNMANADWDSGAILGADNSWRRSVYSTADHILAALSQSTAGEDEA